MWKLLKLSVLFAVLLKVCTAQVPDAPSAKMKSDPFWNKKFIAVNVALVASTVYDVEVTHHGLQKGNCWEANGWSGPRPSRAQLYRDQMIPAAAIVGLGMLLRKGRLPIAPYVPAMMGTVIHVQAGTGWFTSGCY